MRTLKLKKGTRGKQVVIHGCQRKPKKKRKLSRFRITPIQLLNRIRRVSRQLAYFMTDYNQRRLETAAAIANLTTVSQNLAREITILQQSRLTDLARGGGIVSPIPFQGIISILTPRLGTTVALETDAGPIVGTLAEVGSDYARMNEPTGAIVFIPFGQINTIE
ncbi:hypothetical protein SY83_01800 [Paenibacillus swuensis]|uniref:Uncharacterized protein n=1 Tax=Paenibacillus swuensis TaxID=1178515 RepID=A0A172TE08_9BACL|nr:hypothetical protein [Paenibacillus swuensis]ANE45271.1 hypothetical protein SY83_01800 [Paenibacillus swuensis]